jgi:hypothetical protein
VTKNGRKALDPKMSKKIQKFQLPFSVMHRAFRTGNGRKWQLIQEEMKRKTAFIERKRR